MDTRLDAVETASKKVVYKASQFIGSKIADTVTKPNDDNANKKEPAEEIIVVPKKKRWNIKQIEESIINMEHYKIS